MAKPEHVFKAGAVRASIFVNTIERHGQTIPIPKVVIEVRYRDKTGQWQGTNSLSLNEVPKAITALQQSYEYMLNQGTQETSAPSDLPLSSNEPMQPMVQANTRWHGAASSMERYTR